MNNQLILEIIEDVALCEFYSNVKNYEGDAGFDLYCPNDLDVPSNAKGFKIRLGVKGALYDEEGGKSYMLVPRSSMGSKTPLRLSNSVGIIDQSYRGELMAIVDNLSEDVYNIKSGDRLFQIVPFDGKGVDGFVMDKVDDTIRGENGFGSTGR